MSNTPLPRLRDNILIFPPDGVKGGGEKFTVRIAETNEVFEFGEQEAFIIKELQHGAGEIELMERFNTRFGSKIAAEEIQEFVSLLSNWGLIAEEDKVQVSSAGPGTRQESPPRGRGWHLFNPEPLLDLFDRLLSPLRGLVWLILVAAALGLGGVISHRETIAAEIAAASLHFGLIGRLLFAGFTVNLASQLFRGVVGRHYGLNVKSCSINLMFGLLPRIHIHVVPSPEMSKEQLLWLIVTSILVRLALFATGATIWLTAKHTGTFLSTIGAELALISAIGFLFTINPLWRGDGYNLLATWIDTPDLAHRANIALRGLIWGRPTVVARYYGDVKALALYGLVSGAFLVVFITFLLFTVAQRLEEKYQGAGVALFLGLFIYAVIFHRKLSNQGRRRGAEVAGEEEAGGEFLGGKRGSNSSVQKGGLIKKALGRRLRFFLLAALLALFFLPYEYEAGGVAEIFPSASREIYSETDGVVEKVFFYGGEWVARGEVIAKMSSHRQQRDVSTTRAQLVAKQKDIDVLRSTPLPEAVSLAEKQLETAELEERYSREEAERQERLLAKGTVSVQEVDDARKQRDIDRQQVIEKTASLAALKAQINPNEIASAEAELQKLREDLDYYEEQLRRTSLRMPIDGTIVTTKLNDIENAYLEEGKLFAAVEDSRAVRVEIAVPETDVREVSIGDSVRLRTWSAPKSFSYGQVTEISPQASKDTYGAVINVVALLPNPDGKLKSGMTGYAKIEGEETFLIVAFTRALVRFFLVEVWSWLP